MESTTVKMMTPASRAAALKREKAAAAKLARAAGKVAAAERRAAVKAAWEEALRKGHEALEAKIEAARKDHPDTITELKKKWEHDMMFDLYTDRVNASHSKNFK